MFKAALCAVAVVAAVRSFRKLQAGDYGFKPVIVTDTFEQYHFCQHIKPGWLFHRVIVYKLSRATLICSKHKTGHEKPNHSFVWVRSLLPIQCFVVKLKNEEDLEARLAKVAEVFKDRAEPELHAKLDAAIIKLKMSQ
jgi:hypothetical protein